jgi:hypothetical protein
MNYKRALKSKIIEKYEKTATQEKDQIQGGGLKKRLNTIEKIAGYT